MFIAARDGTPQIYLADLEGGSPKPVTTLSSGVQAPLVVSPDGRRVAFVSDVFPDCRDERCNKSRADARDKDPVKARRLTGLMFRHWNEWRETNRHHVMVAELDGGATLDVTPGDFDAPPHNYEDGGIAFSADSRQVAVVSKREGRDIEAWSTNTDVWVVPATGGDLKKLTPNPAADDSPLFTPDGRSVIVRAQRRPGFEADRWYLDVHDLSNGGTRTVFDSPDLVDEFRLSPGINHRRGAGTRNLFVVPFAGGRKRIATGGSIGSINPATFRRLRQVNDERAA